MADCVRRHERAIEVHAVDERVDAQHFRAIPLRLDDRRIVADADEQPGRRGRELRLDARNQLAFTDVGDRHFA